MENKKNENEKIIIQGKFSRGIGIIILIVGIIIATGLFAYSWQWGLNAYDYEWDYLRHGRTKFDHWLEYSYSHPFIYGGIPVLIVSAIVYWALSFSKIVVTDKRVYGKTLFGKKVELPLDKISAVSTAPLVKGLGVSTSSGCIRFALLKNTNEVADSITQLLILRQSDKPKIETADDLKKYKKLLDDGVITQEEFNAKKKQILNL